MRIGSTLFLVLMLSSILAYGAKKNEPEKIDSIKIITVGPYITSFLRVSCSDFDNKWSDIKDTFTLVAKKDMKLVSKEILKAKMGQSNFNVPQVLDIRAKLLVFYSSGSIDTVCIREYSRDIVVNGNYMILSSNTLSNFVFFGSPQRRSK